MRAKSWVAVALPPSFLTRWAPVAALIAACGGCGSPQTPDAAVQSPPGATTKEGNVSSNSDADVHSFARPEEARVTHVALDLTADFAAKTLSGTATLSIARAPGSKVVVLDSRGLNVTGATAPDGRRLEWSRGAVDLVLGQAITVSLPDTAAAKGVTQIVVSYSTAPDAAALQWLTADQTAGRTRPYLYSQGQAILTRTWIPTQDSPGIRQSYSARITVPRELRALMSAEPVTPDGVVGPAGRTFEFRLTQPVPPYLIALAVGDLAFRPLGSKTGVYAEPSVVDVAAAEFAELEQMVVAAETLLGPYRWGRYDVLVLPPSFPFGGMENPRLTFATPTILARDRSLVSLLAHELAHSWSGNLVTNATWRDFWLNEGVTTYVENRIMEAVYGPERAAMLRVLQRRELLDQIASLGGMKAPDTVLHLDLAGRDPDEGSTQIPYDKGAALLVLLERTFGRETFDAYLRSYFDRHAFQSITTAGFVADVRERLFAGDTAKEAAVRLDEWIYTPGLPDNAVLTTSTALQAAANQARAFIGGASAGALRTEGWSTPEWLHFLAELPATLSSPQLTDLDRAFGFTARGNSEVLFVWLRIAIRHHYQPAMSALERFLTLQGRRKFVRPLYEDLMKTDWGPPEARRIYAKARPLYHAVTTGSVDKIVLAKATAE
jgi:leukotriene-A4 hydrolase